MNRRRYAPVSPPVALTIAGSDSGGGAGIQADLKTMEAHGVFGTAVLTATTAQNTTGVHDVHVLPTDHVAAQYDAVVSDFEPDAVKTGMLATAEVIETVADCLAGFAGPVVVDPVMVAATGDRLLSADAEAAYGALLGRATLVTPNADEAELLTDRAVDDPTAAAAAGEELVAMGADAALVKGGHLGGDRVVDTLVVADGEGTRTERFSHPRVDTEATHGSGCTLSSAIAARLAAGEPLSAAVAAGVAFMERAVRYGIDAGGGPGSVQHLVDLRNRAARVDADESAGELADRLAARVDAGALDAIVPADGFDLAVATRFAETAADVASEVAGARSNGDVDGGSNREADADLAAVLLAAREPDPSLRVAIRCGVDGDVEAAAADLGWPIRAVDEVVPGGPLGPDEVVPDAPRGPDEVVPDAEGPVIVVDDAADGSASAVLVAADVDTAVERLESLAGAVAERGED